jgi:predicted phosphodiesterase
MRFAIISDIHSNYEALTKALEIIDAKNISEIICLGDIVGYGASPNECVEIVRERCSIILKGNHDEAAAQPELKATFTALARTAIIWTHKELEKENLLFLSELPYRGKKNDILFVHAAPKNPAAWEYIATEEQAVEQFKSFVEKICFIGHTHTPIIFGREKETKTITVNDRYIINVGSIGQPRDGNPMLSFGIFDTDSWEFELVRSKYDIEAAVKKVLQKGLPEELGFRLRYGR